jgi:translation initiation factor IF-3
MDGISPDPLPPGKPYRVNRNIRAQEVCVIGQQGQQLGIMPIADALNMTRAAGIDLVEIERKGKLPVCRLVDFGMLRYELAKKRKK